MNKEIASIKKRLKTQLEHKHRYIKLIEGAQIDITKESHQQIECRFNNYEKQVDKADMIIEALQKEFILAIGRWSKLMNAEAIKQQWDMIVQEIERGL